MRPPNKSRSRNKNNRRNNNNSGGNVLNRVYDSAGPEGRVRGTPVQVIEKYQALAHDHSLAGDRVAMENFQQHAEHYIRLINEAQRQIAERREQMESQNQHRNSGDENNKNNRNAQSDGNNGSAKQAAQVDPSKSEQPDLAKPPSNRAEDAPKKAEPALETSTVVDEAGSGGLVETPEGETPVVKAEKPRRQRRPKKVVSEEAAPENRPSE